MLFLCQCWREGGGRAGDEEASAQELDIVSGVSIGSTCRLSKREKGVRGGRGRGGGVESVLPPPPPPPLLVFVVFSIWRERSTCMVFFDMRTCPHFGAKLACRRSGTYICF